MKELHKLAFYAMTCALAMVLFLLLTGCAVPGMTAKERAEHNAIKEYIKVDVQFSEASADKIVELEKRVNALERKSSNPIESGIRYNDTICRDLNCQ